MGFDATGGKPYKASQDGPIWYLIVGVVAVLAFGAAFLGPKLLGGGDKGPIQKLVVGRTVPEAAGLINVYGFKDATTQTFLSRLQKFDPEAHAILLTELGEAALMGAEQDRLAAMMMNWTQDYIVVNVDVMRHSDPRYIDKLLPYLKQTFDVVSQTPSGLCELDTLMRVSKDESLMHTYTRYGTTLYDISMQGNSILIGMIENGRKRLENGASVAYLAEAEGLTEEDKITLSAAMMSLMADDDVQQIMSNAQNMQSDKISEGVNVCTVGARAIAKLEDLSPEIRQRLWTTMIMGGTGGVS